MINHATKQILDFLLELYYDKIHSKHKLPHDRQFNFAKNKKL